MADERSVAAMERIERALMRLESASQGNGSPPADDGEARRLREAHQALRDKVEDAIGQIDRLIGAGERS